MLRLIIAAFHGRRSEIPSFLILYAFQVLGVTLLWTFLSLFGNHFIYFCYCCLATPGDCQGLLLALSLEIILGGASKTLWEDKDRTVGCIYPRQVFYLLYYL